MNFFYRSKQDHNEHDDGEEDKNDGRRFGGFMEGQFTLQKTDSKHAGLPDTNRQSQVCIRFKYIEARRRQYPFVPCSFQVIVRDRIIANERYDPNEEAIVADLPLFCEVIAVSRF